MQTVFLTFYQRVILWNSVGNYQAPNLMATEVFLRLINKIRLSDDEARESQFTQAAPGMAWRLPSQNYGDKVVELEDSEAEALVASMKSSPCRVMDAEWMNKIKDELTPDKDEAKDARTPDEVIPRRKPAMVTQ
jgi:hypothetical protein